jgi:hypothetical protein
MTLYAYRFSEPQMTENRLPRILSPILLTETICSFGDTALLLKTCDCSKHHAASWERQKLDRLSK